MREVRRSTVSEKITAAATVATAVAAVKTAQETSKARLEIEALNRAMQYAADKQERIQMGMASEQAESNFRNTVLATLPLLKNEDDKIQFLTEQFLPKLKTAIDIRILYPVELITLVDGKQKIIETYLESESGQGLKKFLSVGNDLIMRQEDLKGRTDGIEETYATLLHKSKKPIGPVDLIKMGLWGLLFYEILNNKSFGIYKVLDLWQREQNFAIKVEASCFASFIFGIILQLSLYRRKNDRINAKIESLMTADIFTGLPIEKQELDKEAELQKIQWEIFKSQIVKLLCDENEYVTTSDARACIMECVTARIEDSIQNLQSFLPPSVRLPPSHYAQFLLTENDVQRFKEEQRNITNLLNERLVPDYENETVVIEETTPRTRKARRGRKSVKR